MALCRLLGNDSRSRLQPISSDKGGMTSERITMEKHRVRVYTDYKSPSPVVANKRLYELEENHQVELVVPPYTLRVAEFMGTVEERTPHFWRKVPYFYMDAPPHAN